jgi:hypothetical protein
MSDAEPSCRVIDPHAIRIPRESGLLPCLYVPVAARDAHVIETYVDKIMTSLDSRRFEQGLPCQSV